MPAVTLSIIWLCAFIQNFKNRNFTIKKNAYSQKNSIVPFLRQLKNGYHTKITLLTWSKTHLFLRIPKSSLEQILH